MAWFIDSWAVLDGLAFASERGSNPIEAETTVFLTVPDLEPVPVGRISTALRAQRASFQDGFRDDTGEEFAFESLDQIREVVRRAYLGGGLGPTPQPAEPSRPNLLLTEGPAPVIDDDFEPDPDIGGRYYDDHLKELGEDERVWKDYSALVDPKSRLELFEELHKTESTSHFYPYLRVFGEGSLLELAREYRDRLHHPDGRMTLMRWAGITIALGLWNDFDDYMRFVERAALPRLARDLLGEWRAAVLFASATAPKDILFRIPCPLRPGWDRRIRSFSDKLFLPLVDRYYFIRNNDLPVFIPALFCSLVVALTPEIGVTNVAVFRRTDRHRLLGRALWWLSNEMPRVDLPFDVEQQLATFAWGRLDLNQSR